MKRIKTSIRFVFNEALIMRCIDSDHYDVETLSGLLKYQFVSVRGWMDSNGIDCNDDTSELLYRVQYKLMQFMNPVKDDD